MCEKRPHLNLLYVYIIIKHVSFLFCFLELYGTVHVGNFTDTEVLIIAAPPLVLAYEIESNTLALEQVEIQVCFHYIDHKFKSFRLFVPLFFVFKIF